MVTKEGLSPGAAALILDPSGLVLIVKENCGKRRWSLPGGLIEPGETPEQAAVRETAEETGVTAKVDHPIDTYEPEDGFKVHVFRCEIVDGVPVVPPTGEIADIRWAHPDSLPMPRSNNLHYAVPDAVLGRRDVVRTGLPIIS